MEGTDTVTVPILPPAAFNAAISHVIVPTSPVSADAALLMTAHVVAAFAGGGLGRMLVQGVAKDLTRRGVKAVEAFGDDAERPRAEAHGRTERGTPTCVLPAAFLRNVGFKTVAPHARWPRLRYEMQTGFNWKEDVEAAIAQLLGSVTISTAPAASPQPARVYSGS